MTNRDYVAGWFSLEDDGPMWALNLMKYRAVADYTDGRDEQISGQEADDRYSPIGPLKAIGGRVLLLAPVVHQLRGDDTRWDRFALAQYPRRRSLPEMNQREDFKQLHVHKDAGMDRTYVLATFPREGQPAPDPSLSAAGDDDRLLLVQVVGDAGADDLAAGLDAARIGVWDIEGWIVGDGREFAEWRVDVISRATADALAARGTVHDDTGYAVIVDPQLDHLAHSLSDPTRVLV
jgi:hypothetical protein